MFKGIVAATYTATIPFNDNYISLLVHGLQDLLVDGVKYIITKK